MGKFRRIPKLFILWFIILFSLQIILGVNGDQGGQNKEEKPSLQQFLVETISTLRDSHKNSWDKLKFIIHELQLKFSPPNLDFKGPNEANVGAKQDVEKVKDAAKKSVEVSKMAVEESAKSAAKAVHKTADKVKDCVSADKREVHDEI